MSQKKEILFTEMDKKSALFLEFQTAVQEHARAWEFFRSADVDFVEASIYQLKAAQLNLDQVCRRAKRHEAGQMC